MSARLDNAQIFYSPTVVRGAITLAHARLDNAQTFYQPTLSQTTPSQALAPSLLVNASQFYAHLITGGDTPDTGAWRPNAGFMSNLGTFMMR
jgi:hypothetical protein